jgi:hypothetical protein
MGGSSESGMFVGMGAAGPFPSLRVFIARANLQPIEVSGR